MIDYQQVIEELKDFLSTDIAIEIEQKDALMPILLIPEKDIKTICKYLYENEKYYFDFLSCITAIDNGVEADSMEVVYNLYSIPFEKSICLKVKLNRQNAEIETVSDIWNSANWHEREAFDMFGIIFTNHPDLRRILMPADWVGHPLKKDYQIQEIYHNIKVEY